MFGDFILFIYLFIFFLFWRENTHISFLLSLSSVAACSAEQHPHACFVSRAQLTDRQVNSYHTFFFFLEKLYPVHKGTGLSKQAKTRTTTENRNKTPGTTTLAYFNNQESWAAGLISVIVISPT